MLHLKEITIQAFRGAPTSVTLDLSAPVTLLYAPNGVGKTSICDAAEWLMTGNVKRLNSGSLSSELRCLFSDSSVETKVSGHLTIGDDSIDVERTLDGCLWTVGKQAQRSVTLSEFLEKLAPSAVEEGVHRTHANTSRQTWLRGNRFLSGESLAVLLDTDENSLESRERLFADLLGVGHLLETERQLDAYLSTIAPFLKKQQTLFEDKTNEMRARQSQTAQQDQIAQEDLVPSAVSKVIEAYRLVNMPLPSLQPIWTLADLRQARTLLQAELERRQSLWNIRRQAEINLSVDWPSRESIELQGEQNQRRSVELTNAKASNTTRRAALSLRITALGRQQKAHQKTIADYRSRRARLDAAFAYAEPLLKRHMSLTKFSFLTARSALQFVRGADQDINRIGKLNNLRLLREEFPLRHREAGELQILQNEMEVAAASVPSSEVSAVKRRELTEIKILAADARRKYEEATGPVGELHLLATTIVDLLKHESECPTCRHDWGTSNALKHAISQAAASLPPSLLEMARDVQVAEDNVRRKEIEAEIEGAAAARAQVASGQIAELKAGLETFATRRLTLGMDVPDANLNGAIEVEISRLTLVDGLQRLLAEFGSSDQIDGDASVEEVVKATQASIERSTLDNTNVLVELSRELKLFEDESRELQHEQEAIDADLIALGRQTESNALRLQTLRSLWEAFCPGELWTDAAFERAAVDLRREHKVLSDTGLLVAQAERLVQSWSDVEELRRLRDALAPIEIEMNRLSGYSDAAEAVKKSYHDLRHQRVRQQMEEFVRVISALFVRMQATEVYEKIMEGSESAPLSWRAISNGLALDPDRKFSQGQKQDFALAIFLARARGLGGTFFLDEPLVHLDDLNRVALLDVFRAISVDPASNVSVVLTTANKSVVRHMVEKFARLNVAGVRDASHKTPYLRVLDLEGNPRTGVSMVNRMALQ